MTDLSRTDARPLPQTAGPIRRRCAFLNGQSRHGHGGELTAPGLGGAYWRHANRLSAGLQHALSRARIFVVGDG